MEVDGVLFEKGKAIAVQRFVISSGEEIRKLAEKSFNLEGIKVDEVIFRKDDGTYIGSFYQTQSGTLLCKWALVAWNRESFAVSPEPGGTAAEAAYAASRGLDTLWTREWAEVEAWGRLRAALRGLGGDL